MIDETAVHTAGMANPRGRALQEFVEAMKKGELKLFPTNVPYIDDLITSGKRYGLPKRATIVVGGQTNVGKTAFVYGWMNEQAVQKPKFTALAFNCEMDNATIMARSITQLLNANGYSVDINDLCEGENVQAGIELYEEKIGSRIELYDNVFDQGQIINIIQKNVEYNKAHGLDTPYIVIDYLQKFKASKKNESDYEATNKVMEWLTSISKRFKTVVIALTAMNRSANNDRKGDTNMLNGASGSGDIEYSADFFMYITKEGSNGRKLELLKSRRSETNQPIHIDFDGSHMTFSYKRKKNDDGEQQTTTPTPTALAFFNSQTLNRTGQKVANDLTGRKRK